MGRLACARAHVGLLAWVALAGAGPDASDVCAAGACAAGAAGDGWLADETISGMSLLQSMQGRSHAGKAPPKHLWTNRANGRAASSSVSYTALADLPATPSWTWANEMGEQVRHSPLIDADKSVYICTTSRIRKFDADGRALWTRHDPLWSIRTAPALYNRSLYVLTDGFEPYVDGVDKKHVLPTLTALALDSGKASWSRPLGELHRGLDAQGMLISDDKVIFGRREYVLDGTDTVVVVSAVDGALLWDYTTDEVLWNFSPASPEDGSVMFSGSCGGVYRLGATGGLLWRAGPHTRWAMCSNGGGALGPDGMYYATWAEKDVKGIKLAAYAVADGALGWTRELPYEATNYPAVGRLGPGGPLAVVVGVGDWIMAPSFNASMEKEHLQRHGGSLRNWVVAIDAGTGSTLWTSEERRWWDAAAAGERDWHNFIDGPICLPDAQAIPVIAGDGTVYAASGHSGDLRAIRDKDGDGVIGPLDVSTFKANKCFLNSPSLAPGMLVAAPCWGPAYVFKA